MSWILKETKILLTGIFGPFGKKTKYAEAHGMQMELLNNQITRQQGIHSPRQFYFTHALFLLAENISVASTVLDFPTWKVFKKELKNGNYTHVGINFIVPNVLKAKRMTEYIRKHYPEIKILLGGYGTIIPELEIIMPYDEKCIGEGVTWLRRYFGEDIHAPIKHPVLQNPIYQKIYGFKTIPRGSVLLPGLGCENGCDFCITSHVFNREYTSFLDTGRTMFEACEAAEKKLGASGFTIMDENFLKSPEKARGLLAEMEKHHKNYVFEIFSSAEVIQNLGIDFLVRLGVKMVWIGVESKRWAHTKTKNIDLKKMITELQNNGIVVNSSAILFLEHHDEKNLKEDVDWVIDLEADLTQFMNYTPFPQTSLYERLSQDGRIKSTEDLHYRYHHGATELNWVHPHITDPEKHFNYTKKAFRRKYLENGSGLLNMTRTAIMGYKKSLQDYKYREENNLVWNPQTLSYEKETGENTDSFMKYRLRKSEKIVMNARPLLLSLYVFSVNKMVRKKTKDTIKTYNEVLGKPKLKDRLKSFILLLFAAVESLRLLGNQLIGNEAIVRQPPVIKTEFLKQSDNQKLTLQTDTEVDNRIEAHVT